jgi:hypothetical protein
MDKIQPLLLLYGYVDSNVPDYSVLRKILSKPEHDGTFPWTGLFILSGSNLEGHHEKNYTVYP